LEDKERGFSFDSDGPLDLRFDPSRGKPASQLLERMTPERLADIIYQYGEERYSRRVARAICERQRVNPIKTASDLANIVRRALPRPPRGKKTIDPATRTFQALRIAVNEELHQLEIALKRLPDCLATGGRLAIISFHSLEDRLVKVAFRDDPRLEPLERKPITASDREIAENPRSRSAKLRVASRVAGS
jgi:16S rRNA (cytosine1402-N4)-methyltransferase